MRLGQRTRPATLPGRELGLALVGVLLLAVFARWLGYTGFFGSDEVTYIASAWRVLDGDWTLDEYVGANRLGVNLPMAAFGALFGRNEFGAAAYSLVCSLCEVLLVTWAGARLFGLRAGVFAGLLLATLPTHVHFAGRIMADAPLAMFITAGFVAFAEGELRRWWPGHFIAGICAGLTFLIKPVTIIIFVVLLLYPLIARRWDPRWWLTVAGFALAMFANGLLYMAVTGRFWYVFESVLERRQSGYLEQGVAAGDIHSAPSFYFAYLFGRIYHTGLLGYLALVGAALLLWRNRRGEDGSRAHAPFVLWWAGGAVLLFSVLPVGFDPLVFIPKQTNYMLMFVAPLCLLGGVALARLPARPALALATVAGVGGLALALLLQASVAQFTANSVRTLEWLRTHDGARLEVMSNAHRAVQFQRLVGGPDLRERVQPIELAAAPAERWAVIDPESFDWDASRPFATPAAVPACWERVEALQGRPRGPGIAFVHAVLGVLPSAAALAPVERRLRAIVEPRPALRYRIPPGC